MNTEPLITEFTLSQAQAFLNQHLNNSDRLTRKWSWAMSIKWRSAWNMVEDHKRRLANGLVPQYNELKTIVNPAQVNSRGHVRSSDRSSFTIVKS